jgi:hypothetical protein
MNKKITLADFLTDEEINRAVHLYTTDKANFHKNCLKEIIQPRMARINRKLGQENDPDYLAYVVEFVIGQYGHGPGNP